MVATISATSVTTQAGKMLATMVDDYAERLQEAMTDAGLSVVALAERIGLSRQAVKKVLEGPSTSFKVGPHYKAARALGVRPEWLALGEAPKHPQQPDTADYRTLLLAIIAEHPSSDARDLMLQLIEKADTVAANVRRVAAPRAKAHTP